jgi:hypothetical protein
LAGVGVAEDEMTDVMIKQAMAANDKLMDTLATIAASKDLYSQEVN